jgi:DNA helicase-2/ATP-dependent DNA helicase PcrA
MFTPSAYQQAIFEWVQNGEGNAFVDAAAGAGKSTTLVQAAALLPKKTKALFCAFNRHISLELAEKLKAVGSKMECRTIHGLGRGALIAGLKRGEYAQDLGEPDGRKYARLASDYINTTAYQEYAQARAVWLAQHPEPEEWDEDEEEKERFPAFDAYELSGYLRKLTDFRRLTLTEPTVEALRSLNAHYDLIEFETPLEEEIFWPILARGVEALVKSGAYEYQRLGNIDYTDMVFLPIYLDLPPARYDWVFVDEAQDLNKAQLELVLRARKAGARLLFCGDRHQSLYGFSGADTRSVDTIIERCQAVVLPLSICYRCPSSHIRLAQQVYSNIEAAPTAETGRLMVLAESRVNREAQPGDYVICRTTAPLVSRCMALIRANRKAVVLGKDLGKNFLELLKKLSKRRNFSFEKLVEIADAYQREQERLLSESKENDLELAQMRDKVATLKALRLAYLTEREGKAGSLSGFQDFIEDFFKPEEDADGRKLDYKAFVTLCTIHKAKGLEANRIFIERSDLLPHPAAKKDWQQEQERNILYVALTRAKRELFFIDQAPESIQLPQEEEGGPLQVVLAQSGEEEREERASSYPLGFEDYEPETVSALFADTFGQSQTALVPASVGRETVEPLDGETVIIVEERTAIAEPLTEGRVARIAAIEILCPLCSGICVDANGSTYITSDLIGHTILCSRCRQQCIVPLNAFSLEGSVIAREKPAQRVSNTKIEKKGRTKKERKSNAGAKPKGKEPRQPLQLSLDVRVIRALKAWGINASALFTELLEQYEPFLEWYASVNDEEQSESEEDEEE